MSEYIKRVDALKAATLAELDADFVIEAIHRIPAADVVEVRHGEWVDTQPQYEDWQASKNGMAYYCSVCKHNAGKYKHNTYKYCPWCGAKMDGKERDDGNKGQMFVWA